MILGLEKDANFKFEKDWEFFTNMFKKQVARQLFIFNDSFLTFSFVSCEFFFFSDNSNLIYTD